MSIKNTFVSKVLSLTFAVGLVLSSLIPYVASAQTVSSPPQEQQEYQPLENVVQIPVVTIDSQVFSDISRIDWDQKVSINGKSVSLSSDEALSPLAVPYDIKVLVKTFRDDKTSIDRTIFMWPWTKTEKKSGLNEGLQFSIAKKLIDRGQLPENYLDLDAQGLVEPGNNVIDVSSSYAMNPSMLTPVEPTSEILDVKIVEQETKDVSIIEKIGDIVKDTLGQIVSWLDFDSAYADVASVTDDAIDYLIAEQNADGSWGSATSTKFIATTAALEALQAHGVTGTTTNDGITWLDNYVPNNNDYLAVQQEVIIKAQGTGTTSLAAIETLASEIDTATGGFKFNRNYKPDPITTAKSLQALYLIEGDIDEYADDEYPPENTYERCHDSIDNDDNGSQDMADVNCAAFANPPAPDQIEMARAHGLGYLINTQRFDNGWSVSEYNSSPITSTAEVIEALLLWKHRSLGATEVDDTLNPAVSLLVSTQSSNGTWGSDLLNTALAYHAIKAAGEIPTYQLETVEYFEDEQEGDGSFDNDVYTTAKVLTALSIATNSGQLLITDIIPTSTIQTGTTTTFNIRMTNPGNVAVDTGKLHIISDDYHISTFDFVANSLIVNASSTVDVTIAINNTRNYLGAVKFKAFIEGTSGVIHLGSRYEETLTYATAADNRPALPMYYVAYKNVSSSSTAAITWRWPLKNDPKLKNVVLMWRVAGSPTWSAANVTATTTATTATLGGLTNNTTYEVTLGTSDNSGNIYNFSATSSVKVSSSIGTYTNGTATGTVKSLDGVIPDIQISGVNASTTALTDEDGIFIQQTIPWGTAYARVNDFRYEAYTKKYATANTNITGVDVYTNLKSDTANPTVTSVSIVGEGDYVMQNKETELIQYTVGDDIGSGGGIVKSASFYYYDPGDTSWHLIGTETGFLTGTRTFAWNIPGGLLGTGFKIKVVARDFAGKDSTGTEWPSANTFELTAGNASPAFIFTAPVSGGANDANTSYTIRWTDSDPEDSATTTLSYDPDNNPSNSNHTLITTVMEDDPTNEYIWNTSGFATSTKYIRADLVDGYNGTTTVYSTVPISISH